MPCNCIDNLNAAKKRPKWVWLALQLPKVQDARAKTVQQVLQVAHDERSWYVNLPCPCRFIAFTIETL